LLPKLLSGELSVAEEAVA